MNPCKYIFTTTTRAGCTPLYWLTQKHIASRVGYRLTEFGSRALNSLNFAPNNQIAHWFRLQHVARAGWDQLLRNWYHRLSPVLARRKVSFRSQSVQQFFLQSGKRLGKHTNLHINKHDQAIFFQLAKALKPLYSAMFNKRFRDIGSCHIWWRHTACTVVTD